MVKYFFEYNDIEGTLFRCEISSDNFTDGATEINGRCYVQYPDVSEHTEAIRGNGMQIELDASLDRTLSDLYADDEREYRVELYKDGNVIFIGYLDPQGMYQDFVNNEWVISLDCVGGLSFLENLSYVDVSGATYSGKQKALDIIVNCLSRIGLDLPINTSVYRKYTGFVDDDGFGNNINILSNVYFDVDRFYKEDEDTIMDCKEVLTSVLDDFGACICQMDGEWWVFSPAKVNSVTDGQTFFRYSPTGSGYIPFELSISTKQSIGSEINGASIFHVNANQRIEMAKALGAYRVNYKYGWEVSKYENPYLEYTTTYVDPDFIFSFDGWNNTNQSYLSGVANGRGMKLLRKIGDINDIVEVVVSDSINILSDDILKLYFELEFVGWINVFYIKLIYNDGTNDYYLDQDLATNDSSWELVGATPDVDQLFRITKLNSIEANVTIDLPPFTANGDLLISFYTPPARDADWYGDLRINKFLISEPSSEHLQGEFHTVQRPELTNVDNVKEVYNGDNSSSIYSGALYKTDQVTLTDTWGRTGVSESKPLLQILAEEKMRINASPVQIFSGDIYGNIPYISKISIDAVEGFFMILGSNYNTYMNVTSLVLRQIYSDELTDIVYEKTFDYGNTVKPTIKG